MTPATAARLVGATPRVSDRRPGAVPRWYAGARCPECGIRDSISIADRGWHCRWDGCRRYGTDLRVLVARVLAVGGADPATIRRALRAA
jgi:hypothetical protein